MTLTADQASENIKARQVANEALEMAITLSKENGLSAEGVRRMCQTLMELAGELIGDRATQEEPVRPKRPPVEIDADCPSDDDPFPFGKHGPKGAGLTYGQVPDSYYNWLAREGCSHPEVVAYMAENGLD